MKFIATLYAIMDNARSGRFHIDGAAAGWLHFLGSVALCGEDQRAGNLAWFLADVGGLQRRYSRRGLSPACRSLAGDFCPLIADIVLALGLFFSSFE